jgi:hypothetical protein
VLQRRPNTFAQTNQLPHFSLATKRRTIHSWLRVIRQLNGHLRYDDYHQLRTSTSARRVLVLSDNMIRLYSLCRMAKL